MCDQVKAFLLSTIFDIFYLTRKEEEVWPDGTHPILFAESSCVACQSFRPVAPFFFSWQKYSFWLFLEYERDVSI